MIISKSLGPEEQATRPLPVNERLLFLFRCAPSKYLWFGAKVNVKTFAFDAIFSIFKTETRCM